MPDSSVPVSSESSTDPALEPSSIFSTLRQSGEAKMFLKNKNAPPSNEHIIYQEPQHNVLGIEIQNGLDQTLTFAAGGAPDDLPESQNKVQGSGIYLSFSKMAPKPLKTFEPEEEKWRTRVVEKTGTLGRKQYWLIIDLPKGDDVHISPDDTLWIPLSFPGAPDAASQSGDVSERYRLKNAGTDAGTSGYSVSSFDSKPPEPLSVGIDGNDEVQIQIEGGDQQVPPSTLTLRLRNSSDVPLVNSASDGHTDFVVCPSTAPADSSPASDVLTSPKFGAGFTAQADNDVAKRHWKIDTNKDEKYIHFKPQKKEVLGPNEQALFRIENIKTGFTPGPSNLYVAVRDLPGYRDTTRVVTVDKIRARPTVEQFTATPVEKGGNKTTYTLNWETYGYNTQTHLKVPSRGIDQKKPHKDSQEITLYQPHAAVTLECRNADGSKPKGHAHWKKTLTLEGSPAKKGLGKVVYPTFGNIYAHDFETGKTSKYRNGDNVLKTVAMTRSPNKLFWADQEDRKSLLRYSDLDGQNVGTLEESIRRFICASYSGEECIYAQKENESKGGGFCLEKNCQNEKGSGLEGVVNTRNEGADFVVYSMSDGAKVSQKSKYRPIVFSSLYHVAGVLIVESGCDLKKFFPVERNYTCAAAGATSEKELGNRWTILLYLIAKSKGENNFYLRSMKMIVDSRGRGKVLGEEKIRQIGDYTKTGYAGLTVEPETKDPIWVEPGASEEEPLADVSSDSEQLYRIRRYVRSRHKVADLLQFSRPENPEITTPTPEQGLLVLPRMNGSE